jgi:6,7-dimethyl-8-ribityllumazine synthase
MAEVKHSNLYEFDAGILTKDACIVIVRTEWNADIVDKLEAGCRKVLESYRVTEICTITVPGAFEIPFGIKHYWDAHKYKDDRPCAFVALGCVIRGDTPHFEYVCQAATQGVLQLNLSLPVPVIFGVLTVDTQGRRSRYYCFENGRANAAGPHLIVYGAQIQYRIPYTVYLIPNTHPRNGHPTFHTVFC